jgi:dipeptidyl aminopeptidase/acylaminoacyl peptidase
MKLALAALAAVLAVAPAAAASSSAWEVAYASPGIWLWSPGGAPHRLRAGEGFHSLAWSPGGRRLAYAHTSSDGVFVMDAAATQWWRVSRTEGDPVWSPDGRRIAIAARKGVYVAAWDGSGARRVSRLWGGVAWSPDGRWLSVTAPAEVRIAAADGSSDRRVLRGRCDTGWAGGRLVGACGLRLVEALPDGRLRILNRPPQDYGVRFVSGSPDGRLVAFGRRCTFTWISPEPYCEIAVERLSDGARRTLVSYPSAEDAGGPAYAPVWIPGSDRLLVGDFGPADGVWLADARTGAATAVRHPYGAVLAAARDGSFAVLQDGMLLVCAPDGTAIGRVRVGSTAIAIAAPKR